MLTLIIGIILVVAIGFIAFTAMEKIVPDPTLSKIGKIAIGAVCLIILIIAGWQALFGAAGSGMPQISGQALISFAIGVLIVLGVIYVLQMLVAYFQFMVAELQYILGLVGLIAILLVAGAALFGGGHHFLPQLR